ncbi:MAG TPA: replication-associated recombination protein A [Gemmatimonadales bacterium]|nr:replication-associated recombination protein A [Gemmatimonadales bacterium]
MARKRDVEPDATLFAAANRSAEPLAARMRPRTLDEFVGQSHLLGPGRPLRVIIERGTPGSMIFWGPPGTGKTTLAHLIAATTHRVFVPFSAVSEGVPRIREIVGQARARLASGGAQTILFVDEIHRLNKAQQDSLLPPAEDGTITLIGATTENPSFEVNGALLSRTRVFVLQPLAAGDILQLLERALADAERGLADQQLTAAPEALAFIAEEADGDARRALTVLEAAANHVGAGGSITVDAAREAMQKRFARYDKAGEEHYNILSAYHKSLRGSDPQGALYWMARMLDGGEDPMTIFRRAIAMAAEDIGLADPNALLIAVAARDAFHMLGAPEGYLPLAEMTIYLATAPKSNSAKVALDAALAAARDTPAAPVPLHIRNAPTGLMKELGYGAGYQYAHNAPSAYIPQEYLPDELRGTRFYEPNPRGFERKVGERMAWWAQQRGGGSAGAGDGPAAEGSPGPEAGHAPAAEASPGVDAPADHPGARGPTGDL